MTAASPSRVAVVGFGPRGLSILERLFALAAPHLDLEILIYEPATPGTGTHTCHQPAYLMLNTVAGQATAFADPSMVDGAPTLGGMSFLAWCQARGVRTPVLPGEPERAVLAADFLPRRVFGEYLQWSAQWLLDRVPARVSIELQPHRVTAVHPRGDRTLVQSEDGRVECVDLAFIATGHGAPGAPRGDSGPALVAQPYPLPEAVAAIEPGARVAVGGMGLASIDIVASLTEGRAGTFSRADDGRLVYRPSGDEPQLVLFSRNGWLPFARPENPRTAPVAARYALTTSRLAELRAQTADGRLRISDVLRLIDEEIRGHDLTASEQRAADRALGLRLDERFADAAAYDAEVRRQARWDLTEARRGLGSSRFKDAMEALRDGRDVLRAAVAPPGMLGEDHRAFFDVIPGLANRAAVGPQIDRLEELLAVADAGIVSFATGPAPSIEPLARGWRLRSSRLEAPADVTVDVLVNGYVDVPGVTVSREPVRASILSWSRPHRADPRFIDLDQDGFVIANDSAAPTTVCVVGPPAEGANYYNNFVLWPGAPSGVLLAVDRAIRRTLLAALPV